MDERESEKLDYSPLDNPEMLVRAFYPSREWNATPPGAQDHMIPVEESVTVSARYYPIEGGPNILYFHGNGEVACYYDQIAKAYNDLGIGLFVADYRGYGRSEGIPTFSSMPSDSDAIFRYFKELTRSSFHASSLFVMGRSLGCISALEVAFGHQAEIGGIIVESGVGNIAENITIFGFTPKATRELAKNISAKINSVKIPALIIHGKQDILVPINAARNLHRDLGSEEKQIVIVPAAGHNNLLVVGEKEYFASILNFLKRNG